jgi:BirA family transcriptional regulator, biotin operon repressor / biotin---[acetyl-CoA-carboxylase] ligase
MTAPRLREPMRLLRYETLGSTNDEAKQLAEAGAPEWSVVWALAQTAGRGRGQREFVSPPGNLYLSVVLRPAGPAGAAAQLGFAAALAVGDAVTAALPSPHDLRYKWPNDVLVDGRKISGILLESAMTADGGLAWLVAGIGVNVASYPTETLWPATSLAALGADEAGVETVMEGFLGAFHGWVQRWCQSGFAPLRDAWLVRAYGLGETVGVRLSSEIFEGRMIDLDRDGTLLVETPAGRRRIAAGEIFPTAA